MPDLFSGATAAQQLLRFLEEKSGAGVFDYDLRTGKVRWSSGMFTLFGVDEGAVEPTVELFRSFVHPQDRFGVDELQDYVANALPFERTMRIILHDGRTRWLSTQFEFLLDHTGTAVRMLGLSMDVTAQRARHFALIAEQERFKGLVTGVAPVVFVADADGLITEVFGWDRLSGRPNKTALGAGWIDALHAEDREATIEAWRVRDRARFYEHEFRIVSLAGEARWIRALAARNVDAGGVAREWNGIVIDMTSHRMEAAAVTQLATGAQIRAARGMLKWSVADLSEASGLSTAVIRRLEEVESHASKSEKALAAIRETFRGAGVDLVFFPGRLPGVRFTRAGTADK